MPKGPQPRRFTVSPTWDRTAKYYDGNDKTVHISGFGLLLHLENLQLRGEPAPTAEELIDQLPLSKRTIDGALADLTRRGLIVGEA